MAIVMVSRTYKWCIDDFNRENLKHEPLTSHEFQYCESSNESQSSTWILKLYPDGFDNESKGEVCFEITLQYNDYGDIAVQADFKLSILKANNEETHSHYATTRFDNNDHVKTRRLFRNFIKLDSILNSTNGLLTNDKLILLFSIRIQEEQDAIFFEESTYRTRLQLSDDLDHFYNSKKLTDVIFIVGDKEFPANKSVLAARSPLLLSKFSLDTKEVKDFVKINDMDPEAFEDLLKFMYTGKWLKCQFVEELSVFADQYAVEGLQEVCERSLSNNIRIDNAMDILQLADSYKALDLKHQAMQFIIENALDIIKTYGFMNIKRPQIHLMRELFCALANKYKHSNSRDKEF